MDALIMLISKVGRGAPILHSLQTTGARLHCVHATVIGAARHALFSNVAVKLLSNPKVACAGCFIKWLRTFRPGRQALGRG